MAENPDDERFDRLLDAMVNKVPLEAADKDAPAREDDLREEGQD